MYRSRHVFAFVIAVVGTVSLVPAIVLLNQELGIIRVSHGVFDLRVNKVGLSNAAAVTISCSIGVTLLV
jgi:fumarate reductase subunit D